MNRFNLVHIIVVKLFVGDAWRRWYQSLSPTAAQEVDCFICLGWQIHAVYAGEIRFDGHLINALGPRFSLRLAARALAGSFQITATYPIHERALEFAMVLSVAPQKASVVSWADLLLSLLSRGGVWCGKRSPARIARSFARAFSPALRCGSPMAI